ncbi:MAG: putative DNA binding domain-containing protein [Erysipelotrichaceae bacterium]|nr:putative DNA binding domain-containing protein [Erysipelotrichaceae bacterium]
MNEDIFDLSLFNSYKEDNRREVKSAKGGMPSSIWETYSSFCNSYGGVIILGVVENKDKTWSTSGLDENRILRLQKEFWDTINNKTKVSCNTLTDSDVKVYSLGNDKVLVINVKRVDRTLMPIYINNDIFNGTYKRDFEGDYHCTKSQVKAMLRDADEESSDSKMVDNMELDVLNSITLNKYRMRFQNKKEDHPWNRLANEDFLVMIGAAKKDDRGIYRPTRAGLMMFGDEPWIQQEYPEYFLDYQEYGPENERWVDRVWSQSADWSGNLFDFYYMVTERLLPHVQRPFMMEGIYRVDDTPIHKAIREALANCITNADFFIPRGIVIKYNDRVITLENPGTIRVGKEQIFKGGVSDPRNKNVMKMFSMLDIGERAGSGMNHIMTAWKEAKWTLPSVDETFDRVERTKVTLVLKDLAPITSNQESKSGEQESKSSEQVNKDNRIELLVEYCTTPRTREEMQTFLGISSREYFRFNFLIPLLESGKLTMTLPDKPNSPKQKYVKK